MEAFRDLILFLNKVGINNFKLLNMIKHNKLIELINLENLDHLTYLSDEDRQKIYDGKKNIKIENYKHQLYKNKIGYLTILDRNYPELLLNTPEPPCLLYYKGRLELIYKKTISIVGTRKPTSYGEKMAKSLVKELAGRGLVIVSGLALGIDGISHRQALESDTGTIGVLASSLDIIYPRANWDIYEKMENQLLLSEFPLTTQPYKVNFVRRNRIISGLSPGTIVIEAKERSGSLITAQYAAHQNREVFCLPGNVDSPSSKGTNDLIKKGAKLIDSIEDIMEEINY